MLDILIKNADIITQNEDRQVITANIGIKDGIISYIGLEELEAIKTIEAQNKIVLPGLINSHMHFGEYFLRGYNDRLTTEEYIEYAEQFNARNLDQAEAIRVLSSKIAILESLTHGSTTLMGLRGFDCAEQYGLRLYMGYPFMKSPKLSSYLEQAVDRINNLSNNNLNNYYIGLHSVRWVDDDILNIISSLYKSSALKLSVHVCETQNEVIECKRKYNMTPVEVLNKYNLLNERTLLVHCNYLSDNDIALISKNNCSVAVCPNSNLKLNNKIADVGKLMGKGINVTLGTDGAATNDSMDLIDSCKTLALLSNLTANQIFDMITVNADRYFNDKMGSIKIGNVADLIMVNKSTSFLTKERYINNLIFAGALSVSDVIINGHIIMEENKFENLNLDDINTEKEQLLSKLKF